MRTQRIQEIFRALEGSDPLIPGPADSDSLSACQKALAEKGYPILPAGAIEFLQLANGFAWNGFEFFGTVETTEEGGRYTLPDIVHMNDAWHENRKDRKELLLLGRFDDDIYVYDHEEDCYKALDDETLMDVDEFSEYDELFICSVNESVYSSHYEEDLDDEDWDEWDDEDPESDT